MNMRLGDPDYNYDHAAKLIRRSAAEKPDVIALPETWNVGFFPKENLRDFCDKEGERTRQEIGALAKELGINIIAGSIANLKDDKIFNTAYVFDRDGNTLATYDKTHLFSPLGEDKYFCKGSNFVTFKLDDVHCGIVICYDIRFAELVRSIALTNIDVLFAVAQWPETRIAHWQVLNKARAIENQIFVCCVNSCAKAGEVKYGGHSALISPWGEVLQEAGSGEQIISGELDLSILDDIRKSINVYRDRRPELYGSLIK